MMIEALRNMTKLATLALTLCTVSALTAESKESRVAVQLQFAPGTDNQVFLDFGDPMVNKHGDVVFFSDVTGESTGLFLKRDSRDTISRIALSGEVVPGIGTLSNDF